MRIITFVLIIQYTIIIIKLSYAFNTFNLNIFFKDVKIAMSNKILFYKKNVW